MGYIGLSLIVATAVLVLIRPPPWLRRQLLLLFHTATTTTTAPAAAPRPADTSSRPPEKTPADSPPAAAPAAPESSAETTPKATPLPDARAVPVPAFALDAPHAAPPPPVNPAPSNAMPPPPPAPRAARASTGLMPPPAARPAAPPRLAAFPAANSPQRASSGPLPNRGGGSGLAPPPSHSSVPAKPSRKVMLTPGHSPLDWARISGPSADLRGLPAASPYLKVSPAMLRKMTGRKGKDAWMAIGGKVYNIGPYADFHPGGVPELMRGAARDATQLFGEVHPWVNYENMLQACLVGILVDEEEPAPAMSMDSMD